MGGRYIDREIKFTLSTYIPDEDYPVSQSIEIDIVNDEGDAYPIVFGAETLSEAIERFDNYDLSEVDI